MGNGVGARWKKKKQLIERLIYAEGAQSELYTLFFNWIGPRIDFIPGIDGPSEWTDQGMNAKKRIYL
ncbi:unnamed protein product [Coffea canephora]|uniref:Uncharacterized protein n=1 Tax=Coffea canephora TaxID=49390 RepID=A0A068UFA8_COFCA|nr:unnamed protein product [Coffea canephora]